MKTFGNDVEFLKKHTDVVVLSDAAGKALVAVVPLYQGRVMTSSADGSAGMSFGWINREQIASGERKAHVNPLGGEDRFWLGPEGGQYAIFFKKGDPFDLEHWQTPEPIDWGGWDIVSKSKSRAQFRMATSLVNYSNTKFSLEISRTIQLVADAELEKHLAVEIGPSVRAVACETDNRITNTGKQPWRKQTGLLSIWILGMFNPSDSTTVVIPFRGGPAGKLGRIVNDAYFGKVPADRLVVRDAVLFFKGDGKCRSKIGVGPSRARPICGSYDTEAGVLTLAQYTLPSGVTDYVNSMWEIQKEPYGGDVVNSYNDGPPAPGAKPLGPFYELETSSPAVALGPGQTLKHVNRTIHMQGPKGELDRIAQAALGVGIDEIRSAFKRQKRY